MSARDTLRGMAVQLATGGAVVPPKDFDAALDAYRDEILSEARTALADFFQPGRTYRITSPHWAFHCIAIDTDPDTGQTVAVGRSKFGRSKAATWVLNQLEQGVWDDGTWDDITDSTT